ncbi:ABC transporter ATP-binding protein [Hymenobacter jejuensis]|uniref:ABC transporter ATP-binding protein n=1 Tax=Hymenobacter jejuensis TaxID=2502781 RepID=A0A5B8A4A8_9BACT|nr:ABC transporter ATP-binding protein [Hymenobacter jejuensis]
MVSNLPPGQFPDSALPFRLPLVLLRVTSSASSSPAIIRVRGLSKRYGNHTVVNDVGFTLAAGETLVLLGPSGCGKTTLLKMLNRLIEPDAGTVEVNGSDIRTQKPELLRRGIGYVIQQVGLLPHYTVAENVAVVPTLLGHNPADISTRTTALLTRLHLPAERYAGQYPSQLSGGQQQRVGLARALAADPPIILMDEPFGALDPITRAAIRRDFRELEELRNKTIVLVTHDVAEAFELADRIALLDGGVVQQLGTPRELLFRPANDFVRRFFEAERLSLQMQVLQLSDLLIFIKSTNHQQSLASALPSLPASATIREALEALTRPSETPDPQLFITQDSVNAQPVTLSQLMLAFGEAVQSIKTTRVEE